MAYALISSIVYATTGVDLKTGKDSFPISDGFWFSNVTYKDVVYSAVKVGGDKVELFEMHPLHQCNIPTIRFTLGTVDVSVNPPPPPNPEPEPAPPSENAMATYSDLFTYEYISVFNVISKYTNVTLLRDFEGHVSGSIFDYVHMNLKNGKFDFNTRVTRSETIAAAKTLVEFKGVHTRFPDEEDEAHTYTFRVYDGRSLVKTISKDLFEKFKKAVTVPGAVFVHEPGHILVKTTNMEIETVFPVRDRKYIDYPNSHEKFARVNS